MTNGRFFQTREYAAGWESIFGDKRQVPDTARPLPQAAPEPGLMPERLPLFPPSTRFQWGHRRITQLVNSWNGTAGEFGEMLRRNGIRYLSYSRVAALDFCSYRYYLEYVEGKSPRPAPDYFTKGKLFHEAAAMFYRTKASTESPDRAAAIDFLEQTASEDTRIHLLNAIQLLFDNAWDGFEVIGVEQPFVLMFDSTLPPVVGVIDLLLRSGRNYVVVDHKTGSEFSSNDSLQAMIYREYVKQTFNPRSCIVVFDNYRWVRDVRRIRKPAFRRSRAEVTSSSRRDASRRLAFAHRRTELISRSRKAALPDGECPRCPLKDICPEARYYWLRL